MIEMNPTIGSTVSLRKAELNLLLADLRSNGYQTVGPRSRTRAFFTKKLRVCRTCRVES